MHKGLLKSVSKSSITKNGLEDFYSPGALGFILQATTPIFTNTDENGTIHVSGNATKPSAPWVPGLKLGRYFLPALDFLAALTVMYILKDHQKIQ